MEILNIESFIHRIRPAATKASPLLQIDRPVPTPLLHMIGLTLKHDPRAKINILVLG
jgi:hypothetical protein